STRPTYSFALIYCTESNVSIAPRNVLRQISRGKRLPNPREDHHGKDTYKRDARRRPGTRPSGHDILSKPGRALAVGSALPARVVHAHPPTDARHRLGCRSGSA